MHEVVLLLLLPVPNKTVMFSSLYAPPCAVPLVVVQPTKASCFDSIHPSRLPKAPPFEKGHGHCQNQDANHNTHLGNKPDIGLIYRARSALPAYATGFRLAGRLPLAACRFRGTGAGAMCFHKFIEALLGCRNLARPFPRKIGTRGGAERSNIVC